MWIFTGMEILFFGLGLLTAAAGWGLWQLYKKYAFTWYSLLSAGMAAFLALFTVLWCFSAIAEGEVRASGMGLLIFGGSCLAFLGLTRQLVLRDSKRSNQAEA